MRTSKSLDNKKQDPARGTEHDHHDGRRCGFFRHPLLRAAVWLCAAVAVFAIVDSICSYVLSPYGAYTETRWWLYRQQKDEDLDTIVVGPSFAMLDVDPNVLDDQMGSNSWTLATQAQSLDSSYWGLETAIRDHHIKRAILEIGYSSLCTRPYFSTTLTFVQHRIRNESLPLAAHDSLEFLFDTNFDSLSRSLSSTSPWAASHVDYNLTSVRKNLEFRRMYQTPLEATEADDAEWQYQGKGFAGYDRHADFGTVDTLSSGQSADQELRDDNLQSLERICDLCRSNGVDLYVIAAPQPYFEVLSRSNYASNMSRVETLCTEHGARYLDFNMAKHDVYSINTEDFMDREHLNLAGSRVFSTALASEISKVSAGEPISQDFYSYDQFDDYLDSIDVVSAIYGHVEVESDGIRITCGAYKGSNVEVEWRFEVQDTAAGEWRIVQPYGSDPNCFIPTEGRGSVTVRECARKVGSTADYECYVIDNIVY